MIKTALSALTIALGIASFSSVTTAQETPEDRIAAAGHTLPNAATPIANYVTWRRAGNILYLSGHTDCITSVKGKVGADLNIEQGYQSAQNVGLCMLATMKAAVGDLSKVKQVLQIMGMVNTSPDFGDQPKVVNGFSDLFVVAFGPDGKGARAAVGMNSLPSGLAVEINAVVELHED